MTWVAQGLDILKNYFAHPVLWVGVLSLLVVYWRRTTNERKSFHVALNRDWFEARMFIKTALLGGVVASVLALVLGATTTVTFGWWYSIFAVLALIIWTLSSYDASWLAVLLAAAVTWLQPTLGSETVSEITPDDFWLSSALKPTAAVVFLLVALIFVIRIIMFKQLRWSNFTAKITRGKRGRRIALYRQQHLAVVPVILLVPGDSWVSHLSFYPMIAVGHHFSITCLPLVVLLTSRVVKTAMKAAVQAEKRLNWWLVVLCVVAAIAGWLLPQASLIIAGVIFLGVLCGKWWLHHQAVLANNWYVETDNGVRVIAVLPGTPAAKMRLQPGDVILDCNDQAVHSEGELYAALQRNSAYVKMRVQTYQGDLRLAEAAIFAGAPHEIGLILFPDEAEFSAMK